MMNATIQKSGDVPKCCDGQETDIENCQGPKFYIEGCCNAVHVPVHWYHRTGINVNKYMSLKELRSRSWR